MMTGIFINYFLTAVRKTWMPGGHEGSQESDTNPYRTLIEATNLGIENLYSHFDEEGL